MIVTTFLGYLKAHINDFFRQHFLNKKWLSINQNLKLSTQSFLNLPVRILYIDVRHEKNIELACLPADDFISASVANCNQKAVSLYLKRNSLIIEILSFWR